LVVLIGGVTPVQTDVQFDKLRGGAPEGKRNGNFRHGGRTKDATNTSRCVNELARLLRDIE
jgi:hypothetical protein